MNRHAPIDYDLYRERAAELRRAAIAAWFDAGIQWAANHAARLRSGATATAAVAACRPQRTGHRGLVA